jgi:hypothetical protein
LSYTGGIGKPSFLGVFNMVGSLTDCLRRNTWLLFVSFIAYTAASIVGSLTVDAESTTPAIWLLTMWAMLAFGTVIMIAVAVECAMAVMPNSGDTST